MCFSSRSGGGGNNRPEYAAQKASGPHSAPKSGQDFRGNKMEKEFVSFKITNLLRNQSLITDKGGKGTWKG